MSERSDADILREMQQLERVHAEAAGKSEPAAGKFGYCRSCSAPIRWLLTAAGKYMPVDARTADETDVHFDHRKHTSHFATCSDPNRWRKRK